MESFGRYIAAIMAITLLLGVFVQLGNTRLQRVRKVYAIELVREFVEKSTHQGEITLEEWELLNIRVQEVTDLFLLGISVGKGKDSGVSYYRMTYQDEIKEILYREGNYSLQTGDVLMIQIQEAKAGRYECIGKSV